MKKFKIGVVGGGSWATAMVKILLENEKNVNWWMRNQDIIDHIKKHGRNPNYISSAQLEKEKINISNDLNTIITRSDCLVFAIPAAFLKHSLIELNQSLKDKFIVSAIKGIVPEDNTIVAEFFHKQHEVPYENIGIITGPCHAEEVALERLSYLTVACQEESKAHWLAEKLNCRYINTNVSQDIFGTEISAVLKNVIAIASGICHSLGYGDNFQAVLISNAIREIKRFVDAVHPIQRDIKESAYLGDLLVTAYSQFSRNRTFGSMIGKGYSVRSTQLEMNMIAEGYYAVKCIKAINNQHDVDMPITDAVYNILYEKISPSLEMRILSENIN